MSPVAMKLSPRLSIEFISSVSSVRAGGGGAAATGGAATGGAATGAAGCGGGATGNAGTGGGAAGGGIGCTIEGASDGLTLAVATTHSSRTTLLSATVSSLSRRSTEISIGPAKFIGGSTVALASSRLG